MPLPGPNQESSELTCNQDGNACLRGRTTSTQVSHNLSTSEHHAVREGRHGVAVLVVTRQKPCLNVLQSASCVFDAGSQVFFGKANPSDVNYTEYYGEYYTNGLLLCVPLNCSISDVDTEYSNPNNFQAAVIADGDLAIAYTFLYWYW